METWHETRVTRCPEPWPELEAQVLHLATTLGARPGVLAVAVLGSVARGEEAGARIGGRRELFSDVELLAITAGRQPGARRAAAIRAAEALAATFGYRSVRFHVDVLFRDRRRLGSLPASIFTHELRAAGRTVWGHELLPAVRPVTLANLDRRNTHEILLKRLWHLAEALPASWVRGERLNELEARDLGTGLWRNPLDIPTALLPGAGILLPSYAARVERWQREPALGPRPALDRALGEDSGLWFGRCLANRRSALAAVDPGLEHERAVRGLTGALAWLAGVEREGLGAALGARSRHIFREQPISPGEWLALARQLSAVARSEGGPAAARWGAGPRKGWLAQGLVALHQALTAGLAGDTATAEAALATAVRCGRAVGRSRLAGPGPSGPWPDAWLAARAVLARAFWRTYRLAAPNAWPTLTQRIDWPTAAD